MKKIIWVVRRNSLGIASLRYRTLFPAIGLEGKVQNIIAHKEFPTDLSNVEAVVFSKAFNENNVEFAYRAHQHNIKIFIELCDNIFIENYAKTSFDIDPNYGFLEIIPITSGIITTTTQLKDTILQYLPKKYQKIPFLLSPDGIENAQLIYNMGKFKGKNTHRTFWAKLKIFPNKIKTRCKNLIKLIIRWETEEKRNKKFYFKIKRQKEKGKKIILWYGNAGDENFGLSDLKKIIPILERKDFSKFELVVISNNEEKFLRLKGKSKVKCHYYKWNLWIVYDILKLADFVIVPNQLNEFSICKSPNRTLLALAHGVPVIADRTPALEKYKNYFHHDDWSKDFDLLLANSQKNLVNNFQTSLEKKELLPETIGDNYLKFLKESPTIHLENNRTIVFIQFIQDFILFDSLLERLKEINLTFKIYILKKALKKTPEIKKFIQKYYDYCILINQELIDKPNYPFFKNAKYLLTASESNLNPHKAARNFVNLANNNGVNTFTFQHGYENIGLTYSDQYQDIKQINFNSNKIFIWGNLNSLHQEIPQETKDKCVPLGVLKKPKSLEKTSQKKQVAIFENLHWTRYSDHYRTQFMQFISDLAQKHLNIKFVIKSHPAGKWLIKNKDLLPKSSNIIFAPPGDSADTIISESFATLTTPSTIAIDSMLNNTSTAVFNIDLGLKHFENAFLINNFDELSNFITISQELNSFSNLDNSSIIRMNASQHFINNYLNS